MPSNVWTDLPAGEQSTEELEFRLQEAYRAMAGRIGWGRPILFDQYDGSDAALRVRSLEPTVSLFADEGNYDNSVLYRGDNDGHAFTGPWTFTGDGEITGNVVLVGDMDHTGDTLQAGDHDQTGNFNLTGPMDVDGTFHGTGAATLDSTLHLIGALTADGAGTLGDAAADAWLFKGTNTFNEDSTFKKALIVEGNTTLGNAAGDTVTVTATATVKEDLTLEKGLIVDTTTFVVDETNNKVGILAVPASTDAPLQAAGTIRSTNNTGAPTAGAGISMQYDASGQIGYLIAYDYSGATYKTMSILADNLAINPGGTQKMKIDTTGVGVFAHATAGQAADWGTVSTGTADATYGTAERDSINEHSVAINAIRTALRSWGWVA